MITFLVTLFDALISFFLILVLVLVTAVLPYLMLTFLPLPATIAIIVIGLIVLKYL